MARKSPHQPDAEGAQPRDVDLEDVEVDDAEGTAADPSADGPAREADHAMWEETRIEPVEIALPAGVGFTLRAYRPSTELTPTEVADGEEDDPFAARSRRVDEDDESVVILDEQFLAEEAEDESGTGDRDGRRKNADAETDEADEAAPEDFEDEEDEQQGQEAVEDVPVFLTHQGKLLLFKSPESLVSFARSGAPHDMAQLDTWPDLIERLRPADIAPADEDSYELDLVVENLRGGHDTWDLTLLIEAGEVARDLAYALRLRPVLTALAPGSPLDDLDDALRAAAGGGVGGFMGRRRLKKIGAQQASLGWRTIIGKISAAVDWRD